MSTCTGIGIEFLRGDRRFASCGVQCPLDQDAALYFPDEHGEQIDLLADLFEAWERS